MRHHLEANEWMQERLAERTDLPIGWVFNLTDEMLGLLNALPKAQAATALRYIQWLLGTQFCDIEDVNLSMFAPDASLTITATSKGILATYAVYVGPKGNAYRLREAKRKGGRSYIRERVADRYAFWNTRRMIGDPVA